MKAKTKLTTILAAISLFLSTAAWTQELPKPSPTADKISIGLSAGHFRYDPGVAVEFTTKAFLQDQISIRVKGSIQWLEAYKATYDHWANYRSFSAGLVYNGTITDRVRFYVEMGMLAIVPDVSFSDESFIEGFYEFNGLEITITEKPNLLMTFFFGAGPAFIDATAEKIEGSPRYGNGIHYINGLRVYF